MGTGAIDSPVVRDVTSCLSMIVLRLKMRILINTPAISLCTSAGRSCNIPSLGTDYSFILYRAF